MNEQKGGHTRENGMIEEQKDMDRERDTEALRGRYIGTEKQAKRNKKRS